MCHCTELDVTATIVCLIFLCLHLSIDLYNGGLKLRLLSSNNPRLHKRLTELLLPQLPGLTCLLYNNVNILLNVLEGECSWLCFLEISISYSLLLFHYFVYNYSCSVCCCIFVYFLIIPFMLVIVVILGNATIYKQVHCFCICSFCL